MHSNHINYSFKTYIDLERQIETIREDVLRYSHDIPTKYLYKGWQGWKNWVLLRSAFGRISQANILLDLHFKDIFEIIKQSAKEKAIDIISLGVGDGSEDVNILRKLTNLEHKKFNYFTVDYSKAILERGTSIIIRDANEIVKTNKLHLNNIHGFCLDIESIGLHENLFKSESTVRLFHLLGLTLGNNKETTLLENIVNTMSVDDFLLFDIDIISSSKNKEAVTSQIEKYSTEASKKFLTSPLLYGLDIGQTRGGKSNYRFPKNFEVEFSDFQECAKNRRSDIEGAISLCRKHIFFDSSNKRIGARICDFSNKYEFDSFESFLTNFCSEHSLEIIPKKASDNRTYNFWGASGKDKTNYFVFLRKKLTPIDSHKKKIISISTVNKVFKKIYDDMSMTLLIVRDDSSLIRLEKEQGSTTLKNLFNNINQEKKKTILKFLRNKKYLGLDDELLEKHKTPSMLKIILSEIQNNVSI